ncbi:MAG TPA: DUF4118 domain-containing protein, partial [Terriglobia bacterium]|nr:DUF4118 domain-containing protein [Terriglobia bacterium]
MGFRDRLASKTPVMAKTLDILAKLGRPNRGLSTANRTETTARSGASLLRGGHVLSDKFLRYRPLIGTILRKVLRAVAAAAIVGAILLIEFHSRVRLHNSTVTCTLLLAIIFFAVRWERLETLVASLVAAVGFLYYFQPPAYTFKASDWQSYIEVAGLLVTALVVSQTELMARRQAAEALERKQETERLYELGQAMLATDSLQTTVWVAINQTVPIFGIPGAAFYLRANGEIHRAGASDEITDDALRAAGDTRALHIDHAAGFAIIPIWMGEEQIGCLGLCGAELSETILKSIGSLLSTVLERVHASEKLVMEKRVSESLLLNILPGEVADELRAKG